MSAEFIVKSNLFKGSNRPELILGTDSIVRFQIVDSSGSPIPQNAADRYTVAVDKNFNHSDSLMAFTSDVTVVDSENGILEAVIPCDTVEFKRKLSELERITVWIELARYSAGKSNPEILLRDTCSALNRVQYGESEPKPSEVEYYTAAQVDALLASRAVSLAACSGLGEYLSYNAFTMTWIDPDDVTLNGATLAAWNQTVLVRKAGSYPADHSDGTILATTSRELGNKNAYRSTGYTDSERESGTTYYYKLFSQTTAGVWNNLTANQFVENTNMSWGMVQAFVRAGRGAELFPVGTVFEVEHPEYTVDGHGIYFRVVGHDQVPAADESLTHTMCLEMVDILFSAPYDAAESAYALTADATAQAAKSYYVYNGSTYTKLIEGTDYDTGDAVPAASWYEKNIDGHDVGSNNPTQNNLIQWANSDGAANQWFVPQTLWDKCSTALGEKNGFMKYLDPLFSAVVKPAKLISVRTSAEGGGSIIHNAKFWALSMTQVLGRSDYGIHENEQLQYYADGGSTVKNIYSSSQVTAWYLRSANNYSTNDVFYVQTTGTATSDDASLNKGFSLACIIA